MIRSKSVEARRMKSVGRSKVDNDRMRFSVRSFEVRNFKVQLLKDGPKAGKQLNIFRADLDRSKAGQ